MIIYYKTCPKCYNLLSNKVPMIIRDTNAHQSIDYGGKEPVELLPGDTLSVFCGKCIKK